MDDKLAERKRHEDQQCKLAAPGNPHQKIGGYGTYRIYEMDVEAESK